MSKNSTQNNIKTFFLEVTFLWSFSGKLGRIRAKIIRTPKILPAPAPMCCTTTDLGIFLECFGSVLGIFGVALVRALLLTQHAYFSTRTLLTRYCTMYYCNEHYQRFKLGGWRKAQHTTLRQSST